MFVYFLTMDYGRTAPISNLTFQTSTETITSVRFNLSEASVLASIGSDRTFTLYDIRTGKAERRVIMQVSEEGFNYPGPSYSNYLLFRDRCVAIHWRGRRRFQQRYSWGQKTTTCTRLMCGTSVHLRRYTKHTLLL